MPLRLLLYSLSCFDFSVTREKSEKCFKKLKSKSVFKAFVLKYGKEKA